MNNSQNDSHIEALSSVTGIEIKIIKQLTFETQSEPKRLKREFVPTLLSREILEDLSYPTEKTVELPGLSFKLSSNEDGYEIIPKLRKELEAKNYRIFLTSDIAEDIHEVVNLSILSSSNDFEPLVYFQTNGINYGITTQILIDELRNLDQHLEIKILGVGNDWCEFEITKEPENWSSIVKKIFKLCPDIADRYNYLERDFQNILENTRKLYLWFD